MLPEGDSTYGLINICEGVAVPALPIQPTLGRHRRHPVLACGRQGRLRRSGWPDQPAHQHRGVGTAITEGTANFLVNRRMNKSQQMRWSRQGANLLLQVRCAVYNGALGSGYGQRFHPANDTRPHPQAIAARPPNVRRSLSRLPGVFGPRNELRDCLGFGIVHSEEMCPSQSAEPQDPPIRLPLFFNDQNIPEPHRNHQGISVGNVPSADAM